MMKKILPALLCAALLASCLKNDDDSLNGSADNYSVPRAETEREYNGEFTLDWKVDGKSVGASTLQVMVTANILALPHDWLHQQIFPGQQVTLLGDDISQIWAMHLMMTGYSDENCYFKIQNTAYEQSVDIGGQMLSYKVCFAPERSTTLYNKTTDSWTGIAPIDSIVVSDEVNRTNHHATVISVKRFSPALNLSFSTTSRTRK